MKKNNSMDNLKVGDHIIDTHMTRLKGKIIAPEITKIDHKRGRLVCNDAGEQQAYPHSFYSFEHMKKWYTVEQATALFT